MTVCRGNKRVAEGDEKMEGTMKERERVSVYVGD